MSAPSIDEYKELRKATLRMDEGTINYFMAGSCFAIFILNAGMSFTRGQAGEDTW